MSRLRPSRRQVLTWAGAGAAWMLVPGCKPGSTPTGPTPTPPATGPTFFTADERTMLAALADVVVPPDDRVGASAMGAVNYIERLLTALDPANPTPTLFVSGPNSSRNPVPDANGAQTNTPPENDFATLLPLDRVQSYAWKLYLYGSDAAGGGPNDAVLGKVIGLRDQIRDGLQKALGALSKPVTELNVADQAASFNGLAPDFQALIIELTLQGCWSAPEYGGNLNQSGWVLTNFEGDVEPFGYTQWDEATQSMIERPSHPVSTPNPGTDPDPLDADVEALITEAVQLLGGTVFS